MKEGNVMSLREFLISISAVSVATLLYKVRIPSEKQVMTVYSRFLERELERIPGHDTYVTPVSIAGEEIQRLVGSKEKRRRATLPAEVGGILGRELLLVLGQYNYSGDLGGFELHLGLHGAPLEGSVPIFLQEPDRVALITIDSITNLAPVVTHLGLPCEPNEHYENAPLSSFKAGMLDNIVGGGVGHRMVDGWIKNLGSGVLIASTDIPMSLAIQKEIRYFALPSSLDFFRDLDDAKKAVGGGILTVTAEMLIGKLLSMRMSRRELLLNPTKLIGVGLGAYYAMQAVFSIMRFIENFDIANHAEYSFIAEHIGFQVKDRTPEDFLGRVEAFLASDQGKRNSLVVWLMLRDLTSTYKEIVIAKSDVYRTDERDCQVSIWGAAHDTKIGLLTASEDKILTYIRRLYERFPEQVELAIGSQNIPKDRREGTVWEGLWTASIYGTVKGNRTREVTGVHIWDFPELKAIFG